MENKKSFYIVTIIIYLFVQLLFFELHNTVISIFLTATTSFTIKW